MLIEVCVDSAAGLAEAVAGGADRIELCAALDVGGLTPTARFMVHAAGCGLPVFAMIRPRAGNFIYTTHEVSMMCADIQTARDASLAGVVLGANLADGRLDTSTLTTLTAAANGMGLTLHRAFDLVPDLAEAVETAVTLGFHRILTSGRAQAAAQGEADLARTIALARGRISVMPGAGVGPDSAPLLNRLKVVEAHGSFAAPHPQSGPVVDLGFAPATLRNTDAARIRALRAALAD